MSRFSVCQAGPTRNILSEKVNQDGGADGWPRRECNREGRRDDF
jgi:hypothetical protein